MLNKNPINIKQKNEMSLLVEITNFFVAKIFFCKKMANTHCAKLILLLSCFFILKSNNFIRQVEGLDINGIQFKEGKHI